MMQRLGMVTVAKKTWRRVGHDLCSVCFPSPKDTKTMSCMCKNQKELKKRNEWDEAMALAGVTPLITTCRGRHGGSGRYLMVLHACRRRS